MKVLFLATRSPWPSSDGGRVLMARTLEGLRGRGHTVTVLAPASAETVVPEPFRGDWLRTFFVPVRLRPLVASVVRGLIRRHPGSVMRHYHPAVARLASDLLAREPFDIVHVEQLHALPHAAAAFARRVPVLLRAENVESDLWHASAGLRQWGHVLGAWEARKVALWEGRALGRVAATAALTEKDADRLRRLAPESRVEVVRAPMPSELPACDRALAGAPPIVLLCSRWFPNHDGVTWFLREVWPAVLAGLPGARLHLFGPAGTSGIGAGVIQHAAPEDAQSVFDRGSIFLVPLRIASGTSMRILEAWARGVPVVATPEAAAGLDLAGEESVALARTSAEFTRAFTALFDSRHAVERATTAGRGLLRAGHEPTRIAGDLDRVYTSVIERGAHQAGSPCA